VNNFTFAQSAAWYTVVIFNNRALFPEETAARSIVTGFLDYCVPLRNVLPSSSPYAHATDQQRAAPYIRCIDHHFFNDDWTPRPSIQHLWAVRADGVAADADDRDNTAIALDAFFHQPQAGNRGGLNLANYLGAIYARFNVLRPDAMARNLVECAIIGTIAVARMGNLTDDKAQKIMDGVREQNNLDLTLDSELGRVIFKY
jgi:hypothetical protein